jgi:predicted nucleic acid-binding protein
LIYLDSSAIMRLIRVEPWSEELRQYLGSVDPSLAYATSAVGFVEVRRVLVRDEEEEVIHRRAASLLAPFARVDLTAAVVEQAGRLPEKHLRALDAIHVASAIQLAPVLSAMVSYDGRMIDAAKFAGLPVVAPGMLN